MGYWTLDKILECAERCRTYRQFCYAYPLAYQAARSRDYLPVVRSHCGWTQDNFERTVDLPPMRPLPLKDVVEADGCLLMHALEDPKWPMDTGPTPLKEEIL